MDTDAYRRVVHVRAWRIDGLWAAAAIAAILVVAVALSPPPGKAVAALPLAVLGGVLTIGVRRAPALVLPVLAAGVMTQAVPALVGVPSMLIVLGVIAYRGSWRAAGLGWLITYVAMASVFQLIVLPESISDVLQTLANAGLAAAPVAFGRYLLGVRKAAAVAEERLVETEARRHAEVRAGQLAERSRLAHDLHDIVAHHVGAMTLRASSGRLALATSGNVAVAADALGDIADTGRHVLDELRGLLAVLHDPDAADEEALVTEPKAAIADAVARVRAAGVPVTFDLGPGLAGSSLLVRTTAARVVQEALTNVLKHAGPGTPTQLTARVEPPHTLWIRIENDHPVEQPLAPAALPGSGHGLAGMRNRVALLGGTLTAGPTGEGGWTVAVALPAPPALSAPAGPDPASSAERRPA